MPRVNLTSADKEQYEREQLAKKLLRKIRYAMIDNDVNQHDLSESLGCHQTVTKKIGKRGNPLMLTLDDLLFLNKKLKLNIDMKGLIKDDSCR